jgi:hypothetical protein
MEDLGKDEQPIAREERMKRILALALVLGTAIPALAAQPFKKYDVKSGVITLDSVMKISTLEMKTTIVVSFDDYGMRECKETYKDGQLIGTTFSDGKSIYNLQLNKKTATRAGEAFRGTELRVDLSEMGTQKDRASGKVKQVAPMKIAGKDCDMIEVTGSNGEVTRYGGYKKIMVHLKTGSVTITANKIEDDAAVPASKFQIPAGYTLK